MTIEFPLWMQNNDYSARLDRMLIHSQWDEGVMDLTAFKVTQTGGGAFTVDVAAGMAVVAGDDQVDQGSYLIRSTATEVPVVTAAPGSNSRYDIVVLRVNDPNAGGGAGDNATVAVIAGVASGSPVVPSTPASAIRLAIIGPITPATGSITNSIITDARPIAGSKAIPVGASMPYTGTEAQIPNGFLPEYGQAVSRTDYARLHALYAAAGYPYGSGNGTTTFNLRDKRGRVGVTLDNLGGSDAGRIAAANTLGGTGGFETHTLTDDEMPVHTHAVTDPEHTHTDLGHSHGAKSGTTDYVMLGTGPANSAGFPAGSAMRLQPENDTGSGEAFLENAATGITLGNAGGDDPHNNLQPYILEVSIVRT